MRPTATATRSTIRPTSRSRGVMPSGGRGGREGRRAPRLTRRSLRVGSRVSGSSKKSKSISVSRSVIAFRRAGSLYRGSRISRPESRPRPLQKAASRGVWPPAANRRKTMAGVAATVLTDLVLGRYRPLQPLGRGGSGSVWLARDEKTGEEVALKIVRREGKAASRAEREAKAAARLRHERCLRSRAFATDDRHVYIAYDYVPGRTLREALRDGQLDEWETVEAAP